MLSLKGHFRLTPSFVLPLASLLLHLPLPTFPRPGPLSSSCPPLQSDSALSRNGFGQVPDLCHAKQSTMESMHTNAPLNLTSAVSALL